MGLSKKYSPFFFLIEFLKGAPGLVNFLPPKIHFQNCDFCILNFFLYQCILFTDMVLESETDNNEHLQVKLS